MWALRESLLQASKGSGTAADRFEADVNTAMRAPGQACAAETPASNQPRAQRT